MTTLTLSEARQRVLALDPCDGAREWIGAVSRISAQRAYDRCPRGDWLLWLAVRVGVDRRLVVRAACLCAREALVHVPAGELRPLRAIEIAEAWARGEATLADVRAAQVVAEAAARAAWAADAEAAEAAAQAARAARAAAEAAAWAAAAAAQAAAWAAAAASLTRSADLVRTVIPWPVMRAALEATR